MFNTTILAECRSHRVPLTGTNSRLRGNDKGYSPIRDVAVELGLPQARFQFGERLLGEDDLRFCQQAIE